MRRQVDHHLARARAVGRRSWAHARAEVWESLEAVERAVGRIYENVTIDLAGDRRAAVRVERQDLDEMLGNLIENAAKYGGGRVFVTVATTPDCVEIEVEDDGPGISAAERSAIFDRGARLDPASPAPASASPSSATSPRFTAARSASRKARIWAACSPGSSCGWPGDPLAFDIAPADPRRQIAATITAEIVPIGATACLRSIR